MKLYAEISTQPNQDSHLDLLDCFLHSSMTLRTTALPKMQSNNNGLMPNEFWHEHLIIAFYLLRHALELALKALIEEIPEKKTIHHHNIQKMYDTVSKTLSNKVKEEIQEALAVL
ncbi:MAG: hypothetical protein KAT71_04535 [Gammaproteobacteria bacterium]|nr:hypothetical protein [Gammaproteobacteria bacterium]